MFFIKWYSYSIKKKLSCSPVIVSTLLKMYLNFMPKRLTKFSQQDKKAII